MGMFHINITDFLSAIKILDSNPPHCTDPKIHSLVTATTTTLSAGSTTMRTLLVLSPSVVTSLLSDLPTTCTACTTLVPVKSTLVSPTLAASANVTPT